jgi:hypothetical protein
MVMIVAFEDEGSQAVLDYLVCLSHDADRTSGGLRRLRQKIVHDIKAKFSSYEMSISPLNSISLPLQCRMQSCSHPKSFPSLSAT